MAGVNVFLKGMRDDEQAATSQPAGLGCDLPEPLEIIRLSLASVEAARSRFPGYRLTRLVAARLELDEADIDRSSVSIFLGRFPASPDHSISICGMSSRDTVWRRFSATTGMRHIIIRSGRPATTSIATR